MGLNHRGNTWRRPANGEQRAFNHRTTPEQLAAQKVKEGPPEESWWVSCGTDREAFRRALAAREAAKR